MPVFAVTIPCTAALYVEVEAENEEEAKEKAFGVGFRIKITPDDEDERSIPEFIEFEQHKWITKGNYFQGCINDVEVERLDGEYDDEDEED